MIKPMGPRPAKQISDFDALLQREMAQHLHPHTALPSQLIHARQKLALRKATLMPAQLDFVNDPSKKKAAVCTRRAGKTFVTRHLAAAAVLANEWTDKNRAQPIVQYIAQTRAKAVDLFWTPFKEICRELGLDAHWDDHALRVQFPHGVLLRAGGAEDRDEIEKYRGDAYTLVIIDEAASFGVRVERLVVDSLGMAMLDYGGTIAMVGTPGPVQAGLFYEIYCGRKDDWTCHKWSFLTNIHYPEESRTIKWIENNIGPIADPRTQREAFGNWVSDTASLVYHYTKDRNGWDGVLPDGHKWIYLMGMDLGYRDPTAFVVGAYARTHPTLFIMHAEAHEKMLPSQIAAKVELLRKQYDIRRIVVDTGGSMARSNLEEWNRRYQFGMIAAEKANKYTYIEMMNSEFYQERIRVKDTLSQYITEMAQLVWAEDDEDTVRHDRSKEHAGFANHLCDSGLYLFRESLHYRSKEIAPEPIWGTDDFFRREQLTAKQKAFRKAALRHQRFSYNDLVN